MQFGQKKLGAQAGRQLTAGLDFTHVPARAADAGTEAIAWITSPLREPLKTLLTRSDMQEFFAAFERTLLQKGTGIAGTEPGFLQQKIMQKFRRIAQEMTGQKITETVENTLYATRLWREEKTDAFVVEELRIALRGPSNIPLVAVPTTLFSTPKHAVSDVKGIATFHEVETGEHQLEIRVNDTFIIHRKVTLQTPDGLDAELGEEIEVLLPIVNVQVEELGHTAAPEELEWLKMKHNILIGLFSLMLIAFAYIFYRARQRAKWDL